MAIFERNNLIAKALFDEKCGGEWSEYPKHKPEERMSIKLEPCPFCGGFSRVKKKHLPELFQDKERRWDVPNYVSVRKERLSTDPRCSDCGATIPDCETEDEAEKLWNTRPTNWNKYPEEKPEKSGDYLCFMSDGWYEVRSLFDMAQSDGTTRLSFFEAFVKVTHWRPLPEPPIHVVNNNVEGSD